MGTHFYKFNRSIIGTLIFWGKLEMKYFELQNIDGNVVFKDTEIEYAKDLFNIGRYRTVKSGKSWLNNYLKNKK